MSSKSFSLGIVQVIIEQLAQNTSTNHRGHEPWPKLSCSSTLKACSLVCRSWRPLAQRYLLQKLVLEPLPEPPKPPAPKKPAKKSVWATTSRKRKKPAKEPSPPPPPPPPPPPSPLVSLLESMKNDESWVHHLQTLQIVGKWVISDPQFPQILEILSRPRRLKAIIWDMGCYEECDCQYEFPQDLIKSLEKMLSMAQLTSLHLDSPCSRFLSEILRKPMRFRDELSTPRPPQLLNIGGRDCTRTYTLTPPDYNLCLDLVQALTIVNFGDALSFLEDESGPFKGIIDNASQSLDTLTWIYGPLNGEDYDLSSTHELIQEPQFECLKALRTLNIEAWFNEYETGGSAPYHPHFMHYQLIPTILEQCLKSGTLEVVNIAIEDDPFVDLGDLGANGRFEHDTTRLMSLDEDLAELLAPAIAKGRLKAVKISIMVTGRQRRLDEAKYGVLSAYERKFKSRDSGSETDADAGVAESSAKDGEPTFVKKDWMEQNPGKTEDDFLEAWYRSEAKQDSDDSDDETSYPYWRNFNDTVLSVFPEVQQIKGVNFEVIDTEDYVPCRPAGGCSRMVSIPMII